MLNAIEAYTEHRPEITSRAINLLFDIARIERCNQLLRALKVSPNAGGRGGPSGSSTPPPHPQDTGSPTSQTPTLPYSTPLAPALALSKHHGPALVSAPQPRCLPTPGSEGLSQPPRRAWGLPLHVFHSTCPPGPVPCLHIAGHHGPQVPQV